MILKGSQRGGGRQMALHLLNTDQNEHVDVHEVSGFASSDVQGALAEAYALSKATKCRQYIYSLSLNPPEEAQVNIEVFEKTIDKAEEKLGLAGQPRVIVFHEKEGRRHAHCVWSRINIEEMKAINMSFDRKRLNTLSKQLFIEHEWKLPQGFVDKNKKSPLNFNRSEWQQAQRTGQKPQDINADIQECWAISDNKQAFTHALKDKGYFLAKGNKRAYVAVDTHGEIYSIARKLGKRAKDLEKRLGDPNHLPSVEQTKKVITDQLTQNFKTYHDELRAKHINELAPLLQEKRSLTQTHRTERAQQKAKHEQRSQTEEVKRSERLRKGFKGLWDRLTGSYQRTRRQNESETEKHMLRDRQEKDALIKKQLETRRGLQQRFKQVKSQQRAERQELYKNMNKHFQKLNQKKDLKKLLQQERKEKARNPYQDKGPDFEPEI